MPPRQANTEPGAQGANRNSNGNANFNALANNVSKLNINNRNLLHINQRKNFINELQKRINKVKQRP